MIISTVVPLPGVDCTLIVPSRSFTSSCVTCNPNPIPFWLGSICENGLKILERFSLDMPIPVSVIVILFFCWYVWV